MVGTILSPAVEAVLTKCPNPCLRKTGSAAAMPYKTPLMLMSIISSQSSTLRSSRGETGIKPALLTRTSSLPYRSHANSTGWIRRRAVLRLSVHGRPHHPHPRYESPEQLSSYDIRRHESSHHLAADNPSRGARFYFTLPSD